MPEKFSIAYETRPLTVQSGKEETGTVFWEEVSTHRWDVVWNSTLSTSDLYTIARMIEKAYQWGCQETKNQMQNDFKRLIGLSPFDRP